MKSRQVAEMDLWSSFFIVEKSVRKMEAKNIYQINYIIRFLLLWIIFQVTAAAEESCLYQVTQGKVIQNIITEDIRTTINGVLSDEDCGQKCCDTTSCSAALFKDNVCVLVNCGAFRDGCQYEAVNVSISLITVSRTEQDDETSTKYDVEVYANQSSAINDGVKDTDIESNTVISDRSSHISDLSTPTVSLDIETLETESPANPVLVTKDLSTSTISTTISTVSNVSPTTSTAGRTQLHVTTGGNQQIRLPKDSVSIHAGVTPEQEGDLDYRWKLIEHPNEFHGTQSGSETPNLKLATLALGIYQFKVEVHGDQSYGEAFVNVTVLPKVRVNEPPVAVILPPTQTLTLPTDSTFVDGSKSSDDDGIARYEWEEVQGPLEDNLNKDEQGNFPNEKVLKITGLVVGRYIFKLTVVDTDGATNSTSATIIVKQKINNPPIANAGSNQVIHLPQNSVTLCGNDSTDDWGIVEYKWSPTQESKKGGIDMQGAREKCVKISNLEAGDYTFQLTVTDDAGQEDTAKVKVIVQPESNHPPTANAGEDQQLLLPLDGSGVKVDLDGSKSTDDKGITSVLWKITSGPNSGTILKPASLKTTIVGITQPGEYVVTLTVTDADGDADSNRLEITVKEEQPPVAKAGPDITITLPDNVAILDGSESTDDYGIEEFQWTRTPKSPAAGFVLGGSDHNAVLRVSELVEGTYTFVLRVTNVRGKSTEDEAVVTVLPDPLIGNLAELHLNAEISRFDQEHEGVVIKQLEVLLSLQAEDTIVVRNVFPEHGTGHFVILFYVILKNGKTMQASEITYLLNSKLKHDVDFLEFKFIRAETFVCENNCSGHGRCRSGSHECECEMFWMENFLRVYMGDGKRNCDWSVLYTGIVIFILITLLSCMVWFLTCYCVNRKQNKKPVMRRRKKYTTHDKARYEKLPMKPHRNGHARKNGLRTQAAFKSSSIMRSVSSSTSTLSDSDAAKENTVFERKRLLANGGGKFNGAFDLDSNPSKSSLRKKSSFAKNVNDASFGDAEVGFGHQSTILTVGNSSDEHVL